MAWCPEDLECYVDETKFSVGQFVEVDIPEVPVEERECTWGVVTDIHTKFPLTKKLRRVIYHVKLAGLYIKKSKRVFRGLKGQFDCEAKYLTLKEESNEKGKGNKSKSKSSRSKTT